MTLALSPLPLQPASSLPTAGEGAGVAAWAGLSDGNGGVVWTASSSTATGVVHSNRDLTISGSSNQLVGGTEYVGRLRIGGRDNVVDPEAVQVEAGGYPVAFDIAAYRPGGAVAVAAGSDYHDGTAECESNGTWERHEHATEILTGLHYAPCDVIISAADITGAFTLVSEGTIQVTAARITLGPAFTDDLLLFSNAAGQESILIAGEDSGFDGFVFAPHGSVMLTGANHHVRCGILANEIAVRGFGHTLEGDPGCGNRSPVAMDDAYETDEDAVLEVAAPGVLDNDSDPDGDPLTAVLDTNVSHGVLTLAADGSFTYTPDTDYNGPDSFTYRACDTGTPALCDGATVTITVLSVNDPPVADAGGLYTGTAGSEVLFDGSGSTDPDGSIVAWEWNFGDDKTATGETPTNVYGAAGSYTVTLTVTDNDGATATDTTTAEISEVPNVAPAAADDEYTTDEDTLLEVAAPGVLDNDSDPDGDPMTAMLDTDVSHGVLSLAVDGSFTYEPDKDYRGQDSFTYHANDGAVDSNLATVTITVASVNDPPVADAGPDQAVTVGDVVTLDGSGSSDPDDGETLTFTWVPTARPDGSIAALTDADTDSPTFIPDLPGDYVIELTVDDGNGGTASDTVTVTAARMGMTLTVEDPLIGVGRPTNGTVTLDNPAPPGGIIVTLSLDTGIATVDPTAVPIAPGVAEGTFVVTGVGIGTTTITGSSPATETATVDLGVTDALISIDDIPVLAPDETADLPVSITKPAPPGGVTIHFESLDPSIAITEPTAFVPEGLYVPVANPQITGVDFGTTQIKATALNYGPDTRDVTVALTVTLTPAELDLPELWTLQVSARLSAPAPSGGLTLDLTLDDPFATTQPTVFIPAGQTLTGPIDITGSTTLGTTTLRARGPGLVEGTATINVIDTPDVYVEEFRGCGSFGCSYVYSQPLVVGFDLQFAAVV
ncbi:MAG: tandem-95 repeat protein, partial [Acidimicrobiia bacterium]|nr:tandem-95 repeat protein [Acidimicrobiia bacterium]